MQRTGGGVVEGKSQRGRFFIGICSFVAAIWDATAASGAVGNAGDSPAYLYSYAGNLRELTRIDRALRVVRMNGENVLVNGMPMIQQGLSQAVGQPGEGKPHVAEFETGDRGGILGLTSDGVTAAGLRQFLKERCAHLTENTVREFCESMRLESEDDTTLLAAVIGTVPLPAHLRRLSTYADLDPAGRDELLRAFDAETYLPAAALAAAFWTESQDERQRRLIQLLRRHGRELGREGWLALLNRCATERRRSLPLMSDAARGWMARR